MHRLNLFETDGMHRIQTLLQKLNDLSKTEADKTSVIDIDLMLDYTRVLYADLLEWRGRMQFNEFMPAASDETPVPEPEVESIPTSSAPPVELTSQVQGYATPAEEHEHASESGDVRKLIGINDKYQFISELFGNDKDAYEQALDHVNSFDNYPAAVEWLDEHMHEKYGWKDDQFAVESFYDTLSNFFASR